MNRIDVCFTFLGSGQGSFYIVPSVYNTIMQNGSGCHTCMLDSGSHTLFFTLNTGAGGNVEVKDSSGVIKATYKLAKGHNSNSIPFIV